MPSKNVRQLGVAFVLVAASFGAAVRAQELDPQKANRALAQIEAAAMPGRQPAAKLDDFPQVKQHYDAARQMLAEQKLAQAVAELDAALNLEGGACY